MQLSGTQRDANATMQVRSAASSLVDHMRFQFSMSGRPWL